MPIGKQKIQEINAASVLNYFIHQSDAVLTALFNLIEWICVFLRQQPYFHACLFNIASEYDGHISTSFVNKYVWLCLYDFKSNH